MPACYFATDLHGQPDRYEKLIALIGKERPRALFLGGDLTPHPWAAADNAPEFVNGFLIPRFRRLRADMGADYPAVFLILGNDDYRSGEQEFVDEAARGTWTYVHGTRAKLDHWDVFGYACIPPSPFQLKDWERYDVSRYVPPGCSSPEEGMRSVPVPERDIRFGSIRKDLETMTADADMERAVFLFHSPPHDTNLDRAALDGMMIDHVPLDLHVGSIAVRRFIEDRQPRVTLHGHIHESAELTGSWRDQLGSTCCLGAAHNGPELALVRFDPENPESATRSLL